VLARSPYKPVDPKIAKLAETRGGSGLYNVCIGGRAFSLTLCCRADFALPRPSEATLSPLPPALAYLPHNTQRYEHPIFVLQGRGPAHPSANKRTRKGRALSGERINVVVYTETKAGDFRIVSVITPDGN